MAKFMQIPDIFKPVEQTNLQNKMENIGIVAMDTAQNLRFIPERYIEQLNQSQLEENLLKVVSTLIENHLILVGILYVGNISYDYNIITQGFLGSKAIPELEAIWEKYQKSTISPKFELINEIPYAFFGKFQELFEKLNPNELLALYGALYGMIATNLNNTIENSANLIEFYILSQNVTNSDKTFRPIVDSDLRNQMQQRIQEKLIIPMCEFRLDLGWNAFSKLALWNKIASNPLILNALSNYKAYLAAQDEFENQPSVNLIPETEIELKQNIDDMKLTIDELAAQMNFDAVIRYINNPPPTIFGRSTADGIDIGGSLCFVSFGTGGSIVFDYEITRMVMEGKYMKRLKGNPQIESMTIKEEIRINNEQQFESIITQIFDPLKSKAKIFLGTLEIEANGFESVVFRDLTLKESDLSSLANYFHQHRVRGQSISYKSGDLLEVKFFGEECKIFTDPRSYGCIDFIQLLRTTPWYSQGILMGIVCIGQNKAYFYFLANNQGNEQNTDFIFNANQKTMQLMFSHIDMLDLAPVSWFKISFGTQFLNALEFQEAVQVPFDIQKILEIYGDYIKKIFML